MADSTFDIVSKVDKQEANNALMQAQKEIESRYDFKGVGAEIVGPRRTTRWWFVPGQLGATVEVIEDGERRTHRLQG